MQDIFQKVQTNFMELGIFFSGLDLEKDLAKPAVLKEVYSALIKSYDLFESGLCEIAHMCNKCEANKERMSELILLIRQCQKDEKMSDEAHEALAEFVQIIPVTLSEMKNLYLQSLSEDKA
jgi:hypothetical protein